MTIPTEAASIRRLLDRKRRHRGGHALRNDLVRLLIRTDAQIEQLAAAVAAGIDQHLSCNRIAATLPRWCDENLVRAFVRCSGLEHSLVRNGTWAQYHARKAASGEPYTCRRGKGASYE